MASAKEKRLAQILRIALDEFIEKGFYGTSTREISKKAEISSGLMFHYFSSKEDLYNRLIEIGCTEMHGWGSQNEETQTEKKLADENPIAILESIVTQIFSALDTNPVFAKMFIFIDQAQRQPNITEKSKQLLESNKSIEQSVSLFLRGQELGQIRQGNVTSLAIAFWSAIQGIAQVKAELIEIEMPKVEWIMDIIKETSKR